MTDGQWPNKLYEDHTITGFVQVARDPLFALPRPLVRELLTTCFTLPYYCKFEFNMPSPPSPSTP